LKPNEQKTSAGVGKVYLIGAGPGDPGLITVRGMDLIRRADVIVFDALANRRLLDAAPPDCELIDAGKRARQHKLTQDQTNALLADRALAGRCVVRLKGGDPYVFGRGSEEAIYLHQRGVPVEVVPGITAAIAGPACAGIPVTHRNFATTCTFVTGHESPDKDRTQVDYQSLAGLIQRGGTVCCYMGMGRLPLIVEQLVGFGCSADTPAAVVQWGTLPKQRSARATLAKIVEAVEQHGLGAPAIIVVGQVAALDDQALCWFEQRALFGQTVLLTRTRQQLSQLSEQLQSLGAEVIEAPTICIEPPDDLEKVDQAIRSLGDYDWLVLTSPNGVDALTEALERLALDSRHLAGVRIAVVGDATAERLRDRLGIAADLKPDQAIGEALAERLISQHDIAGKRVCLFRADIARPLLAEKLTQAGATVRDLAAYQTRRVDRLDDEVIDALREGRVDWLTFTSSSTARNLCELVDEVEWLTKPKIASIGPVTSATLRELGLTVAAEAEQFNIDGLVRAMCDAVRS
jgi:uroporphyrinogen III methyltransferase/synthase